MRRGIGENLSVTMDKFLSFWDHYNTAIIEGLIALIILFALFLAYRSLFAKKSEEQVGGVANLDAAQLEKTLQKILESQGQASSERPPAKAAAHSESAAPASEESSGELAGLRNEAAENQKKIETLQARLKDAESKALDAAKNAGAALTEGMSNEEKAQMDAKLRDLETRLAEYEIISEDIADLSRYRSENEDLKKQLEALKGGAAVAPAAPAPAPEPAPVAEPEPAPATGSVQAEAPAPEEEGGLTQEDLDAAFAAATTQAAAPVAEPAAPAPTAEPDANADVVDDELMREFAAAVEGQKSQEKTDKAEDKVVEKSGDAEKLMNEFESFVTKKS